MNGSRRQTDLKEYIIASSANGSNSCSKCSGDDLVSLLRNVNLKVFCYMIAQAWNLISEFTLDIVWNKPLGCNEKCVNSSTDCDDYWTILLRDDDNTHEHDITHQSALL
ncbi:conserved hypothetical protein [Trichinella spiralis]|uniref:hypothetical protein n=1 Tax=Trichinella spiralis TaxID=6334 RepID=UPI0001EFEF1A|nr:conserved hypothetical protein [Trichinella spiralis]XP_003370027.1 conserved hypothetical protein [Trichinella spiralis]